MKQGVTKKTNISYFISLRIYKRDSARLEFFFSPAKTKEIVMNSLSYLLALLVAFILGLVEENVLDGFRDLSNVVAFDYIVVYTKHDELRSYYLQKKQDYKVQRDAMYKKAEEGMISEGRDANLNLRAV